ncbi:MAG: hypothetical protein RIG63_30310 [Coleofasciculus chthonoplastes F3-SA18-01]|uniref:hypothetical protein n=1 Tax=Coleofasciculus chthonoplastes TaxID=64178 RepID=UPI003303C361
MYCSGAESAVVVYSFGDTKEKTFKTKLTPIEIEAGNIPLDASENYDSSGFEVYFYSPNNRRWARATVLDYTITGYYSYYNAHTIGLWYCNAPDYQRNEDGSIVTTLVYLDTLQIDTSVKCPKPPEPAECKAHLKILHGGKILYQDQGKCPVNYKVNCDPCPPNTIRCVEGGKVRCVPCSEFLNPLKQITSKLKQINNG